MEKILEINSLTKKFGRITAVDSLDLSVEKGTVFGILGPNGSGKTTTLGMILGVINPVSGSYSWFNGEQGHKVRRRIGAILEYPCFYHYLSAYNNLKVVAEIKKVGVERIDGVLDRVGLLARKNDPFRTYSLGMKQRLAIASALLADPEVMILDEPTNGLDPQAIADIRELIIDLANEGRTIILASHLLNEVQRICTDFAVLQHGKKIFQGKVADLDQDKTNVEVRSNDLEKLHAHLSASPHVATFRKEGSNFKLALKPGVEITEFHRDLITNGIVLNKLQVNTNTLEQKFLQLLKSEGNA